MYYDAIGGPMQLGKTLTPTGATTHVFDTGGTATEQAPGQPVGRIQQNVSELERLLMTLHDEIGSLEDRLGPFLRPVPPDTPANGTGQVQAAPSQMAQAIGQFGSETHRAIQRVRGLLARVDI